ncbi:isoprenylcysteine carboxylmethyltransferase family protein [Rhodoferax sp.]|uniref:methyltransferase family protein n=1 Tax=Rhodoferax sp. TaxID=50421 RepID=UPI00260EC268|nr:isoprenylcysteine carboxylmethyltransferase family protein [Rhodoferax sp.]MDD5480443.1 isoprenylcysteine carboxylmethyltransferase family protein [Rhodoferax sp.]
MISLLNTHRHRAGQMLVLLQFGLLLWLAWAATPAVMQGNATLACVLLGSLSALLGGWTLAYNRLGNFNIHPAPKAHGQLVTGGPYRLIRHPMYSAVLLAAASMAVLTSPVAGGLAWCALAGVLAVKATLEERWLCEHHAGYAAYSQHTRRFVPWLL